MTKDAANVLTIGDVRLEDPFILGPMAGVTDLPFRILCREMGASLVSMEMISCNAVNHRNRKTKELTKIDEREHPVSMQLFGQDPESVSRAAEALSDVPFDILDFNMGCPMPKIVNNGEGSALLRDLPKAAAIVRALKKVSSRPVTVKIRIGYENGERTAVETALALEDAGADALAVHGRTRQQLYSGEADWEAIADVKKAVKIPVIGNGDIRSAEDALKRMRESGVDAVMIARGARGNPFIFRECVSLWKEGVKAPPATAEEVYETMLRHAAMQMEKTPPEVAVCQMRKHIAWYTAGFPGGAKLRQRINETTGYEELRLVLKEWFESL